MGKIQVLTVNDILRGRDKRVKYVVAGDLIFRQSSPVGDELWCDDSTGESSVGQLVLLEFVRSV